MPQTGRVHAAQGLVECRDVSDLGMIAENGDYAAVRAEHVFGESLESFLRTNFHKHARAGGIQRPQPLDELHGSGNLLCEDIEHLRHNVRTRGIELAIDVSDDGQPWRGEM